MTKTAGVDDIVINILTQVVSPGQDELTDPHAMDHLVWLRNVTDGD